MKEQWAAIKRHALEKEWLERIGMASLEVGVVAVIGLIPLGLAAYLSPSDVSAQLADANHGLSKFIGSGQLFLYCFSFIGTLCWIFLRAGRSCHIGQSAVLLVLIVALAAAAIVTPSRNPSMNALLPEYQADLSIICYLFALLMYFILLMTQSAIADTPDQQAKKRAATLAAKAESLS